MPETANRPVSLIIPTYRREQSLVECLKCAIKQNYQPLEIIVVDQTESHTDETTSFLNNIAEQIKLVGHSPPSAVTARNRGFGESQGDIIIFIDDDTTFEPEFVSAHVDAHQRGADVVQGRIVEPGRGVSYRTQWMLPWLRIVGSNTYDKTGITNTLAGGNFSISRTAYEKVGGFDTNFTGAMLREDADYGARCHKAGLLMIFDAAACLIHHRDSEGGVDAEIKSATRIFEPSVLRNELYFARKHFNPIVVWQYKWRLKRRMKRALKQAGILEPAKIKQLLRNSDIAARNLLKAI